MITSLAGWFPESRQLGNLSLDETDVNLLGETILQRVIRHYSLHSLPRVVTLEGQGLLFNSPSVLPMTTPVGIAGCFPPCWWVEADDGKGQWCWCSVTTARITKHCVVCLLQVCIIVRNSKEWMIHILPWIVIYVWFRTVVKGCWSVYPCGTERSSPGAGEWLNVQVKRKVGARENVTQKQGRIKTERGTHWRWPCTFHLQALIKPSQAGIDLSQNNPFRLSVPGHVGPLQLFMGGGMLCKLPLGCNNVPWETCEL